jgi:hypothetical protein
MLGGIFSGKIEELCVQAWAAAIQNNDVVQVLLMGDLAVASGRQKTLTVGFGADPQATAMSSKDGCGEEVLGVVAAEYTRFDRLLTEVTSGGTKLAILHLIGGQSDPRATRKGIDFFAIWCPPSLVDLSATLATCGTAGP